MNLQRHVRIIEAHGRKGKSDLERGVSKTRQAPATTGVDSFYTRKKWPQLPTGHGAFEHLCYFPRPFHPYSRKSVRLVAEIGPVTQREFCERSRAFQTEHASSEATQ